MLSYIFISVSYIILYYISLYYILANKKYKNIQINYKKIDFIKNLCVYRM